MQNNNLEYKNCIICDKDNSRFLFENFDRQHGTPGIFKIVQCKSCGLIYINPRPKNNSKYYPDEYKPYNLDRRDFFQNLPSRLMESYFKKDKRLRDHLKSFFYKIIYNPIPQELNGKILDIGCGNGTFLYDLKKNGWDVYGMDMSKKAVEFAQNELKLNNVKFSHSDDIEYGENFFDVITMNHVIEHLYDPIKVLNKIRKILKNNGVLIITTPNSDSLNFKIFKKFWFPLETPRHLNIFNYSTMQKILNRNGFYIYKTAHDFSTNHVINSINYISNNNSIIKKFRFIFLPLTIILSFFKKSDVTTFFIKKINSEK